MSSVRFSPDGSRIAVGTGGFNHWEDDRHPSCVIWDAASGAKLKTIPGHSGGTPGLCFSPDGRRIALAYMKTVDVVDLADGRLVRRFGDHPSFVYAVAFSPDGKRLATGGNGAPTRIWDLESGKVLLRFYGSGARAVAFSPDGKEFATCSGKTAAIELFDAASGDEKGNFRGETTTSIAFTPDGKGLVSGDVQGLIKLWDLRLASPIGFRHQTRDSHVWKWIVAVAFHPEGRLIATACRDNAVRLWDDQGNIVRTWEGPTPRGNFWEDEFWSLAISPDGKQVVAGQSLGKVLRFDIETGKELPPLVQGKDRIMAVAFGPQGELATASGRRIQIWNAGSGKPIHQIDVGFGTLVTSVAFNHDGTRLACGIGTDEWLNAPGGVAVCETTTGRSLFSIPVPHDGVRGVAFSPDGRHVAAVNGDGFLVVWNTKGGQEVRSILAHTGRASALAYTPDGSRLLTSGQEALTIWDPRDWTPLLSAATPSILSLAIARSGQRILGGMFEPAVTLLDATPLPAERLTELDALTRKRELALQRRIQTQQDAQRLPTLLKSGEWVEAAEILSRDVERSPKDLIIRHRHMLCLLAARDFQGYRRAASSLLESTRDAVDPFARNSIAWICVIGTGEASDFDEPMRRAEAALKAIPADQRGAVLNTLGAAQCRGLGRLEEAIKTLEEGIKSREGQSVPGDWAFPGDGPSSPWAITTRLASGWNASRPGCGANRGFRWRSLEKSKLLEREARKLRACGNEVRVCSSRGSARKSTVRRMAGRRGPIVDEGDRFQLHPARTTNTCGRLDRAPFIQQPSPEHRSG